MPIEIHELVIRAVVDPQASAARTKGAALDAEELAQLRRELAAECLARLRDELAARRSR
jgi:hypothetical protein